MALALVVPLVVHLVVFEWAGVVKFKWPLLVILALFGIFAWPYGRYVFHFHPRTEEGLSALAGWFFPLLGGQHLTAVGLGSFMGEGWTHEFDDPVPGIVFFAQVVSCLGYVAVWCGIVLAIGRAGQFFGIDQSRRRSIICVYCVWGYLFFRSGSMAFSGRMDSIIISMRRGLLTSFSRGWRSMRWGKGNFPA